MRFYILLSIIILTSLSTWSQSITGDWSGSLKVGPGQTLKITFHIKPDKSVTMDSPDQNVYGMKCETIHLSSDSISITLPAWRIQYSGTLTDNQINGTFNQVGIKFPLTLKPESAKVNRPQTPVPPFPYSTEQITVSHNGISLAGTLTIPQGATSNTPVAVMVTGSGAQDRDEQLFEHKPFAVIADYLARHGIATLRYDDRGFGQSTGDRTHATTAHYADDAQAVVSWLRAQNRFSKVGIIGHSEGGMIAYMLAAKPQSPDYIISIAGPTVKGSKTSGFQNSVTVMQQGVDSLTAKHFGQAIERAFEYKQQHDAVASPSPGLIKDIYPEYDSSLVTRQLSASITAVLTDTTKDAWLDFYLSYDPAHDLRAVKIPAFLIFGEKDLQVPPSLNVDIARTLAPHATVVVYPGLNHLMQHATTGGVSEYKDIEETFATEVLANIASFINQLK